MKKTSCFFVCFVLSFVLVWGNHNVVLNTIATRTILWGMDFDSFADIQDFVSLVYGEPNGEAYKKYTSVSYTKVKEVATNISSTSQWPCVTEEAPLDGFIASYKERYVKEIGGYKPVFYTIYVVNGVRYQFWVDYNDDDQVGIVDGRKWLENQTIGSVTFDLYEKNGVLVGNYKMGGNVFSVTVYTNRVGNINFDYFELAIIPQNPGSE